MTRHCDEYIEDVDAPAALRAFLEFNRRPAVAKVGASPKLFATLSRDRQAASGAVINAGERVRVVMASRFGDVGITRKLGAEHGYETRVFVDGLANFDDAP